MAATTKGAWLCNVRSLTPQLNHNFVKTSRNLHALQSVSLSDFRRSSLSFRSRPRSSTVGLRISCTATGETLKRVRQKITQILGVAEGDQRNESHFVNDIGADGIDVVELKIGFEDEFGVNLPDELPEKAMTVQGAADFIQELLDKN